MIGLAIAGSPPRVRGTVFCLGICNAYRWITPACAGNRMMGGDTYNVSMDHPRVCGEQSRRSSARLSRMGSPPRVRGTGPVG